MPTGIYKHKPCSEETKKKLSINHMGHVVLEETRKKMSLSHSGEKHHMFGKKHSEETKKKMSEANKRRILAGTHNWWKGGIDRGIYAKIKLEKQEIIAGRKKPQACELCGRGGKICFDHDHKTDKFRGWLCGRCNTVLGLVNEDTYLLSLMIEYLKKALDELKK